MKARTKHVLNDEPNNVCARIMFLDAVLITAVLLAGLGSSARKMCPWGREPVSLKWTSAPLSL